MRWSAADLENYQQRQAGFSHQAKQEAAGSAKTVAPLSSHSSKEKGAQKGLKLTKPLAQKKSLRIVLPFRLPTWNMLLAANPWQRKKIRDWLHAAMCSLEVCENASLIPTELVLKPVLTASSIESYCRMITPKSSGASGTSKKRVTRIKRRS